MQRHPLDILSLVFGLVFVAIATIGLTDAFALEAADMRLLGPALLVLLGVTLLLGTGRGGSDRDDDEVVEPPSEPVGTDHG